MKKALAFLLAAVMLLGLSTVALAADSVTLNVVTSYGGDDGNRANFEAAVKAYEESTGNKVNDGSATSNEEWKAKVLTDFETGSEPDVLFFFTNADAEPFISAGKVVSIDEIRAEYPDFATNMKSSMMAVAADGKQYSVPSSGYWENMFVNKAVLADCGVEVPGPDYTWDQFLADCAAIKEAGYTPIACSLVEVPHYWFEFMVMNNGTVANHLEVPAAADDAAAAKWAAGLNDIKALYEAGFFPANTLTASDAETVELFNSGEAAVEFVSQLTSDEVLSTFVTTEVTALVNGASPAGLNPLQQSAADANANITAIAGAVQDLLTAEARGDLFANVQNIVTGKISAEDAVAQAIALN